MGFSGEEIGEEAAGGGKGERAEAKGYERVSKEFGEKCAPEDVGDDDGGGPAVVENVAGFEEFEDGEGIGPVVIEGEWGPGADDEKRGDDYRGAERCVARILT